MISNWKKNFFIMWLGQGVSTFTSSVIQMAMVWYLTDRTGSAAVLTMATLIGYLPQVLLGPFIGVFIDRYNRKLIMICSDLFLAAVALVVVISGFYGEVPVWLIMIVLFMRSIGATFHNPSLQAVTPLIVPAEELTRYAGFSQGVESVSMLLSPALAATLYGVFSLNKIIIFGVLGPIFAIATLYFVVIPKACDITQTMGNNIIKEAMEGLSIIKNDKGLGSLLLVSALYAIIYFPIGTLFPLIAMDYFKGGFKASSVVETVFSVGMLLGALVLGFLGKRIHGMNAISFSIGLYGLCLVITGLLPPSGLVLFIGISFVMGISIPFYRGVKIAIIQSKVQSEYLGRVLSLTTSIQSLAMPIGLILAGIFAEIIGVDQWFLISGVITLILAALSIILPSVKGNSA